MSNMGERIKLSRKLKGLSQVKLAEIAGVAQSMVVRYESNETESPSYQTLSKIARALDTTADDLMEGSGEASPDNPCIENQLNSVIQSLDQSNQNILLAIAKTLKLHQKPPEENKMLEKIKRILAD